MPGNCRRHTSFSVVAGPQRTIAYASGRLLPRASSGSTLVPARELKRHKMVPESYYVALSAVLFSMGVLGVLVRRNPLVIFMSIELMLNASNLALVALGQRHGTLEGQALVFFVMCVAAAEVAVGLAIIVAIFRLRRRLSVDELNLMRWECEPQPQARRA